MTHPRQDVLFECCVDSVASAVAAAEGGAGRIELCANLIEGGTTPSAGLVSVCAERVAIPVFVIVRPRGGDFLYDDDELAVMIADIDIAKDAGAAGVVLGVLRANGTIDRDAVRRLLDQGNPLPVTFHLAFDMTRDLQASLDTLVELGVDRVLTSGGGATALDGADAIAALVRQAGERIVVMAGGGVRAAGVAELVRRTGVREVHARLVAPVASDMEFRATKRISRAVTPNEYQRLETTAEAVAEMIRALRA